MKASLNIKTFFKLLNIVFTKELDFKNNYKNWWVCFNLKISRSYVEVKFHSLSIHRIMYYKFTSRLIYFKFSRTSVQEMIYKLCYSEKLYFINSFKKFWV